MVLYLHLAQAANSQHRVYFWKSSIQYLAKKVDGQIKYEGNGEKINKKEIRQNEKRMETTIICHQEGNAVFSVMCVKKYGHDLCYG